MLREKQDWMWLSFLVLNWLKHQGNASKLIDDFAQAIAGDLKPADHPSEKLEVTITRELKAALNQLQQLQGIRKRQDYHVIRDKVLTSLKLGKQARI